MDKQARLVPLEANEAQLHVFAAMYTQRALGLPVRILVLKSRQRGISTGVAADYFTEVYHKPNRHAVVLAHVQKATEGLFEMTQRFEENLPQDERRKMKFRNKHELTFATPHGSWYRVMTAGEGEEHAKKTGRSMTIHYLHYSEVAFCVNAKQVLTAILQCVPPGEPDTAVVLESTANGPSGEFYDRWGMAMKRMKERPTDFDGYVPIFLSWLDQPEYRRKVPRDYDFGHLDEDEQALVVLGADAEQLYWRRWMILHRFNADVSLFKQEYPSTAEESFQGSGRPGIPPVIVAHHRTTVEEECKDYEHQAGLGYRKCNLHWDSKCPGGVRPEFGDHILEPCWRVWRTPEENTDYTVAGDVARGELSDQEDDKSEPDWSTGFVLNRVELSQAAEYRGQILPGDLGIELLKAAWWYCRAWATPEVNDAGRTSLEKFRMSHYARTYRRREADARLDIRDVTHLGWETTPGNRKYLIDSWLEHCKPDLPGSWEGKVVVRSSRLCDEESTFVYKKTGKREHASGCFDDILFAAMIALRLHLDCPRTLDVREPRRARAVLCYHGAVDPGVDELERSDVERTG